jgi:hypothetical protein
MRVQSVNSNSNAQWETLAKTFLNLLSYWVLGAAFLKGDRFGYPYGSTAASLSMEGI